MKSARILVFQYQTESGILKIANPMYTKMVYILEVTFPDSKTWKLKFFEKIFGFSETYGREKVGKYVSRHTHTIFRFPKQIKIKNIIL